jgi:hypothetical protein
MYYGGSKYLQVSAVLCSLPYVLALFIQVGGRERETEREGKREREEEREREKQQAVPSWRTDRCLQQLPVLAPWLLRTSKSRLRSSVLSLSTNSDFRHGPLEPFFIS